MSVLESPTPTVSLLGGFISVCVTLAACFAMFAAYVLFGKRVGDARHLAPSLACAVFGPVLNLIGGHYAGLPFLLLPAAALTSVGCAVSLLVVIREMVDFGVRCSVHCSIACCLSLLVIAPLFPIFCLFCPIGLVFGTLWAINRVFVLLQPGWELVIFPLMLFVELFLFKRWCASVCPLGFLFSLIGKARAKLGFGLHPRSDCSRCLSGQGCETCSIICPESIDVSANGASTLEACSLCLDCMENCPTKSIALKTGNAARNASDEAASDRDAQER